MNIRDKNRGTKGYLGYDGISGVRRDTKGYPGYEGVRRDIRGTGHEGDIRIMRGDPRYEGETMKQQILLIPHHMTLLSFLL